MFELWDICDHRRDDPDFGLKVAEFERLEDAEICAKALNKHYVNPFMAFEVWSEDKLLCRYETEHIGTGGVRTKKCSQKFLKMIMEFYNRNLEIERVK